MNKRKIVSIVAVAALLGAALWAGLTSWPGSAPGMDPGGALYAGPSTIPSPLSPGPSHIFPEEHPVLNRVAAESVDAMGRIGITVVDGSGIPLGGASVDLVVNYEEDQKPPTRITGMTGADGSLWSECAHRSVAYVYVAAWHPNQVRTTQRFLGSQVQWLNRVIELGPVMLEAGGQLEGCVHDDVGRSLHIQPVGSDISPVRLVWGRNGVFWSADRVLPGRFRISLDGVVSGKVSPEEFDIPPGALSHHVDVRISFPDRGPDDAISGTVIDWRGSPVPGCAVVARGESFRGGVSDSEGKFVVHREGEPSASVQLSVASFHDTDLRFAYRPWVGARSYAWGESHVRVELAESCSIRLHVFVGDQRLRSYDYRLYQSPAGAEPMLMSAIDDGSGVLVASVRPGKNQVVLIPPSSSGISPWIGTVDANGVQQDCYLRLDATAGVRVIVKDQDNRGLPDVQLEVLDMSCVTSNDPMRLESISPIVMFRLGQGLPVRVASGVTAKDGTCDFPGCAGENLAVRASWRGHVAWQALREPESGAHGEVVIAMPAGGGCVLSIDLGALPAKDPRWEYYGVRLVSLDHAEGSPAFLPWNGDGVMRLDETGLARFDACRAGSYSVWLFGGKRSGGWIGLRPSLGQVEVRDGQVTEISFLVAYSMGSLRVAPASACEGAWRVVAELPEARESSDSSLSVFVARGQAGAAFIEGMPAGRYQVGLFTGGSHIDCGEVDIQADRQTTLAPDLGRKLKIHASSNGRSIGGGTKCRVLDAGTERLLFEGYTDGDGCIELWVRSSVRVLRVVANTHNVGRELQGDVPIGDDTKTPIDVALR